MPRSSSRREFLVNVGRGTLLATLGPTAIDLGLMPRAFAQELESPLLFGDLEPLVCELQETPVDKLQSLLVRKLKDGESLRTLVGAGALANARTFGGEDYIGFHTFMALAPALKMSQLLPTHSAPLPVLKVLYRNTDRIQSFGGRVAEVLHPVPTSNSSVVVDDALLHQAVEARDAVRAEQLLAKLVADDRHRALRALLPLVQENPEVHRTVLPFRAWDMQGIVGTEHALTLLRQSLRYCLQSEVYRRDSWNEPATMLTRLLDEFQLNAKPKGTKQADDEFVRRLSEDFAQCTPDDAARAAATTLAEGFPRLASSVKPCHSRPADWCCVTADVCLSTNRQSSQRVASTATRSEFMPATPQMRGAISHP